ncbi:hypothetical protein ACWGIB_17865 [Streptomyces xiamenensis]
MTAPRRDLNPGVGRAGTLNGWWERGTCAGCRRRDGPVTWIGPPARGGPYTPVLVCADCLPRVRLIAAPYRRPASLPGRTTRRVAGTVPAYRLPEPPDDGRLRALRRAAGGCTVLLAILLVVLAVTVRRAV